MTLLKFKKGVLDRNISLTEIIELLSDKKRFDLSGKMYIDVDGVVKWNFSKNKDKAVLADAGFVNWFMQQGFPQESKNKIKELQNNSKKES